MKAVICLEKFSDWLEAYSLFTHFPAISEVKIIYIENQRNSKKAVESLFAEIKERISFTYEGTSNRTLFFTAIGNCIPMLQKGDVLAAPFIRYRNIWSYISETKKRGIVSIHLSESLPDSFGRLGYRLGFRLQNGSDAKEILKQLCIMPLMYGYATQHMPDFCFYNMAPAVKNPFVKKTIKASIPALDAHKKSFLLEHATGEKRPLLIAGFGYDLDKMVEVLQVKRYIATSKNREIIIDGIIYPLDEYICAEEVLLSGCVDAIIGYNSTAMCWAYLLGGVEITCYESKALSRQYGFMNGSLTRKTLKKCGIELLPEHPGMVCS